MIEYPHAASASQTSPSPGYAPVHFPSPGPAHMSTSSATRSPAAPSAGTLGIACRPASVMSDTSEFAVSSTYVLMPMPASARASSGRGHAREPDADREVVGRDRQAAVESRVVVGTAVDLAQGDPGHPRRSGRRRPDGRGRFASGPGALRCHGERDRHLTAAAAIPTTATTTAAAPSARRVIVPAPRRQERSGDSPRCDGAAWRHSARC